MPKTVPQIAASRQLDSTFLTLIQDESIWSASGAGLAPTYVRLAVRYSLTQTGRCGGTVSASVKMEKTVRFGCAGSKGIERKLSPACRRHRARREQLRQSHRRPRQPLLPPRPLRAGRPAGPAGPSRREGSLRIVSVSARPSLADLNARIDADSDDFAVALDRLYRHLESRAPERLMQLKTATMSLALRTKARGTGRNTTCRWATATTAVREPRPPRRVPCSDVRSMWGHSSIAGASTMMMAKVSSLSLMSSSFVVHFSRQRSVLPRTFTHRASSLPPSTSNVSR